MENDLNLFSVNAIRSMEVIDISTGSKLGYVKDFKVDVSEQRVVAIILPSPVKSWFGKESDIEIGWDKVVKTGIDVLLVDASEIQRQLEQNTI